jgi:hypothetical protein
LIRRIQIRGLDEFARWGFTWEHPNDHMVELRHLGRLVVRLSQTDPRNAGGELRGNT